VTVTVSVTVSFSEAPVALGTGIIVKIALPGSPPPPLVTIVVGGGLEVKEACGEAGGWATGDGAEGFGAGISTVVVRVLLARTV